MKIALITDIHFGIRSDSPKILEQKEKFFSNVFFPYLHENGIDTIFDLGDTFDKRKQINFYTLTQSKKIFFDPISKMGLDYYAIVGNHNTYYKNTNEINSLDLLLKEYENIHVFRDEPVNLSFGSTTFKFVPWIAKENYESSWNSIRKYDADVILAHISITGHEMHKGFLCPNGYDRSAFSKYERVFSGHFHQQSEIGNVKYLGAPYEMTWSDCDEKRGFHIFDTETKEIEFIENPYKNFYKINYSEEFTTSEFLDQDLSYFENSYVKVHVDEEMRNEKADLFFTKINSYNPLDLKIIEKKSTLQQEELIEESKTTVDLIHDYVDKLVDLDVDKELVKTLLLKTYEEAMELE